MDKLFQIVVAVWQAKGEINFLEDGIRGEVEQAVGVYNEKYGGFKELKLVEITKSTISFKLKVVVPDNEKVDVSRSISYLSKQLYHNHGWSRFSKVANRLFTVVESEEITVDEAATMDVRWEESDIYKVQGEVSQTILDDDIEKLRWLYASQNYINYLIRRLEANGVRI